MEENEELPEIQKKSINGVEITNLDLAKIAMICDYLVVDRFHDISSFVRFERCFGPLFPKEPTEFLQEVFREICGEKKKYISFGRLILAYTKWISKSSTNANFNKFMDLVFGSMIKTQNEVIGQLVEGGRVFSTRNTRGRKVISRFSVLTDSSKNKLEGFQIQYDDVFDAILSPKKTRDDITLEMNFPPESRNIRDRDGISHVGGKYSVTKKIIKLLIFKCRSGKTFYIGDEREEDGEEFQFFLFGTSSCQLKSLRVELVDGQLIYIEPKFQPSLRLNQKIVDFNSMDENYINENIINAPLIFEENEMQNLSMEQLIETNSLLIPCISDDAFIDKNLLEEPLSGKDFNEIYKTFLVSQSEQLDAEKEELKKKIYEKTVMRKKLLKIYFGKFKIRENILVLKTKKPAEQRVNMDKFLCKIKAYKKKMNKKIEEQKKQLETNAGEEEGEGVWDDEEDWVEDKNLENNENKEEPPKEPEQPKEEEIKKEEQQEQQEQPKEEEKKEEIQQEQQEQPKEEENKNVEPQEQQEQPKEEEIKKNIEPEIPKVEENVNKEENKIEIEPPKIDENKIDVEPPKVENEIKIEENKVEINVEVPKNEDLKVEIHGEEKGVLEIENEKEKVEPQEEEIKLRANRPKKILKKAQKNPEEMQEEPKKEENKIEEPKKEEIKLEEPKKEENKIEEPKKEENKIEEPKKEENKIEEPKKEENKIEEPKKEENKNENKIIIEQNNINNKAKEENVPKDKNEGVKKEEPKKKKRGWFCICF